MTILDIGCGTGYFTTEIAKLLNNSGKIVAVDVQQGMLEIIEKKIENCDYGNRIELLLSSKHSLQLTEKFDFILAFYSFFPRN